MTEPEPEFILTGVLSDGRHVLVTVWERDADIAFRRTPADTWGPPTYLDRLDTA